MPQVLNEGDLKQPVRVSTGEPIVVRLVENPTTGYRWRFATFPDGKVQVLSDTFKRAGEAFGSGGVRELTLTPLEPGHHVVVLRNSFAAISSASDPEARLQIDVD